MKRGLVIAAAAFEQAERLGTAALQPAIDSSHLTSHRELGRGDGVKGIQEWRSHASAPFPFPSSATAPLES